MKNNINLCVHLLFQLLFFFKISCHSIAWLVTNLMLIWVFNNSNLYQMQVNLLIGISKIKLMTHCFEELYQKIKIVSGLMFDIILVVTLKAITRRKRPTINGNFVPEKDSFPSGHSTRATFITYFFLNLWPVPLLCIPFLLAWSFSVCMSRLLVRKHHIVDILAGIALGIFQGLLIGCMYLEQETCASLVWWITDEKISGAEYDI